MHELMAQNIQRLARNARDMGRQARRFVERNYSWENTFRALFTLYEQVLGSLPSQVHPAR